MGRPVRCNGLFGPLIRAKLLFTTILATDFLQLGLADESLSID